MDIVSPSFSRLKKNLKKALPGKSVKIAVLADFASQFVSQAIQGYGIEMSKRYEIFEADYDQIERQVFDFSSELYKFQPDYIIILKCTEKFIKKFYRKVGVERADFSETYIGEFNHLIETLKSRLPSKIVTNNYIELNDGVFGNFASKTSVSSLFQLRKTNLLLMELSQRSKDLFLLDLDALVTNTGHVNSFDTKMYYNADMVFSIDFLPLVAKNVYDIVQAIEGTFNKCIILDLDNTMWGGVIGDDGIEGIQIGELGLGKVFSDFQSWIKELKERGIILAVCSKNNELIAKSPFGSHPQMIIRLDDIVMFIANWENKPDNIRHIQRTLNVGMDSIVFIDDNPFERELVKKELPEITVPDLPEDPADYLSYLRTLNLFETASFLDSDILRTSQYKQEASREISKKSCTDEDEFLLSLRMSSIVKDLDSFTIPRVAQLSQRSNQFNLRTIRYTEQELTEIADQNRYHSLSFTLSDKFGDNGLIAFVILKEIQNDTLFIENWAMSCRVLKRGMELFILNCIVSYSLDKGYKELVGEYLMSNKNMIVKDHYESLGFLKQANGIWTLNLDNYLITPTHINKVQ